MPTSAEILAGLARIANDAFFLAVLWHVAIMAAAIAAITGWWRPTVRTVATLLSLPLASVALVGWSLNSPVNGAVFTLLSIVLLALARRAPAERARLATSWTGYVGLIMIGFAWVYPHFLVGRSQLAYLVGAPLGLLPCPTLALMLGVMLVLDNHARAKAFSLTLAAAGVAYAAFGAIRLGVRLDLALLAGAVALIVSIASARPVARRRPDIAVLPGGPQVAR